MVTERQEPAMYHSVIGKFLTLLSLGAVMVLQGCGQADGITGRSAHANPPAYPAIREIVVNVTPTYDEKIALEATAETRWQNAQTTPQPTGAVKPTDKPITPEVEVMGLPAGAGWIGERPYTPMFHYHV